MTVYTNPFSGNTVAVSPTGYSSISISANTTLQWPVNGNTSPVVSNILEVNATTTNLKLFLPPANQVSNGASFMVNNIGSNTFTIVDNSGNTIASVASGVDWYVYLRDNTTVNGTWAVVQFGASTSVANAASLAGLGLTATGSLLNAALPVTAIFSSASLTAANRAQFLVWSSGVGTLTLPAASTVGNNWFVVIRNSGTGILTITPSGTDTIDGNANLQVQLNTSVVVVSSGTGYSTYGSGQASTFVYTQLVKNITGGTVTLTSAEAANVIQEYTGTLTSNCTIVLPSTVQLYSFYNQTSGSFTLTFKTSAVGALTVTLPQNNTVLAICDGTNVYSASTATVGAVSALTLGPGSAAAPSINFLSNLSTGVYLPGTAQVGVACNGANVATFTATGLTVPAGISGGTF